MCRQNRPTIFRDFSIIITVKSVLVCLLDETSMMVQVKRLLCIIIIMYKFRYIFRDTCIYILNFLVKKSLSFVLDLTAPDTLVLSQDVFLRFGAGDREVLLLTSFLVLANRRRAFTFGKLGL